MAKMDYDMENKPKKGYRQKALDRMKGKSKKFAKGMKDKVTTMGKRIQKNPYYDLGG